MIRLVTHNSAYRGEGETILEALTDARVLSVEVRDDGTVELAEACDGFFGACLTRDQVVQLSEEIRALVP